MRSPSPFGDALLGLASNSPRLGRCSRSEWRLVGVTAGLIGLGFWPTFGIAISWEILEHILKNLVPSLFAYPTQDTLANSIGDVLSALFGWAFATAARQQRDLRRFS